MEAPNWKLICGSRKHKKFLQSKNTNILIQTACQLYSNLTARWRYETGTRVLDGSLVDIGEFPWMVKHFHKLNESLKMKKKDILINCFTS